MGRTLNADSALNAAKASVADAKALSMNAYKIEIAKALVKQTILREY
jgi:CO/xanthine dehydrogenase FAD-binding subunit